MNKGSLLSLLLIAVFLSGCITIQVKETAEQAASKQDQPDTKKVLMNVTEQYYDYEWEYFGSKICKNEPYNFTEDLKIQKYVAEPDDTGEMNHFMVCSIDITNHEAKAGKWEYYMTFHKEKSSIDKEDISNEIQPGETYTFRWRYPQEQFGAVLSCTPVRKSVPTMEKCSYDENSPKRQVKVVKNRTVEKWVEVPVEE